MLKEALKEYLRDLWFGLPFTTMGEGSLIVAYVSIGTPALKEHLSALQFRTDFATKSRTYRKRRIAHAILQALKEYLRVLNGSLRTSLSSPSPTKGGGSWAVN